MAEQPTDTAELDDPHSLRCQRREWIAERIGWVAISLVLLAALAGLLGPGPLSFTSVETADGSARIQYYCVVRSEAATELSIWARPNATAAAVEVSISRAFSDINRLDNVLPLPERVVLDEMSTRYTFALAVPTREAKILIRFEPKQFGRFQHHLTIDDGAEIVFTQLVLP